MVISTPMRADAEKAARDLLLTTWATDLAPGDCRLPVDPTYIAMRLGLSVASTNLDLDISGMIAKRAGGDAEIYLNAADSSNRQRIWLEPA